MLPAEGFRARLLAGLVGAALVKGSGLVLAFAVVATLARVLGPAEFGVYAYVLALVSLIAVPAQLGLPTLVIRETARIQQGGDWGVLKGLWRWSSGFTAGLTLLVLLACLVGVFAFSAGVPEGYVPVLLWGLGLVPLVAWGNLQGAALTGLRKVVQGQLPENVLRPGILLILLVAGILLWPTFEPHALEAMVLTAVAGLLSLTIALGVLRFNRPAEWGSVRPVYRQRAWFAAVWPLSMVAGMQVINRHTDILMLGFFVSADEVGVYRVAAQAAALVGFSLQIVNMVVAPHFARLHASGETERLQRLVTGSARLVLLGAVPAALVLILAGDTVLSLLFGADYALGQTALVVLTIGQLVNAGVGSVALLLNMAGYEKETARGVLIAALINVPLNLLLIPLFGMTGAALATAISLVIWNFILWRAVLRCLGLNSTAFRLDKASRST